MLLHLLPLLNRLSSQLPSSEFFIFHEGDSTERYIGRLRPRRWYAASLLSGEQQYYYLSRPPSLSYSFAWSWYTSRIPELQDLLTYHLCQSMCLCCHLKSGIVYVWKTETPHSSFGSCVCLRGVQRNGLSSLVIHCPTICGSRCAEKQAWDLSLDVLQNFWRGRRWRSTNTTWETTNRFWIFTTTITSATARITYFIHECLLELRHGVG